MYFAIAQAPPLAARTSSLYLACVNITAIIKIKLYSYVSGVRQNKLILDNIKSLYLKQLLEIVTSCQKNYILVVDDVPDNILLLQTILELEGYKVDTAFSGHSALAKIQAAPPALVLLDVMMPDINGLEVIQHIRQNQNLPFIPVVLVTAHREISRDQGFSAGADDFIGKPFDIDKLLAKVSDLLRLK